MEEDCLAITLFKRLGHTGPVMVWALDTKTDVASFVYQHIDIADALAIIAQLVKAFQFEPEGVLAALNEAGRR